MIKTKKYKAMKKATMTLAIAFAMIIMTSNLADAMHATQLSELILGFQNEMVIEEELQLEKWMYTPESFDRISTESGIELSEWMIETSSWKDNSLAEETELQLEDWMLKNFENDNAIALEDWMTRISG
jgi:hypothetical protein